ncbi:MAG: hypothetical protein KDD44_04290 [Bdellovibrionales bacterium]|nr:hypothetical protein [Bdellovibrionales bacterium]
MTVTGLPQRGQTLYGPIDDIPASFTNSLLKEGAPMQFMDMAPPTAGVPIGVRRSGMLAHAVLLRNSSAGVLVAGDLIVWEPEYIGRRTNGKTAAAGDYCCGVVDDHLTYSVRVNDLFWCIYKGPCLVNKITSAGIADLAIVEASATAGKCQTQAAPGSATEAMNDAQSSIGMCIATALTADTQVLVNLDVRFGGP